MATNLSQNVASNTPQAPMQPYGLIGQLSSGPAGVLYSLANQLIAIYNRLQELYNQMTQAETLVQRDTITAGAKAQMSAASSQAWSIGCQAFGAFASAGITAFTSYTAQKGNKASMEKLGVQEKELAPLKSLDDLKKTGPNLNVGEEGLESAHVATQRASDFTNQRNYHFEETGDAKVIEQRNQDAINTMNADEYKLFKTNLAKEIESKTSEINTTQSKIQAHQSTWQTYGQIASSLTNTGSQAGQAGFTYAAENARASQQVANGITQMASSSADNTRGNIGQYYAKVSDVIAAARQGAQAYAQT
jgi:hypothetical protein